MCGRASTPERIDYYKALLPDDFEVFDVKKVNFVIDEKVVTNVEFNTYLLGEMEDLPENYINYNVAPTTKIPILANDHPKMVRLMPWRYDMKIQGKIIPLFNSKIEQAEKNNAYFRYDLQERRCVVLFKGFYEWIKQDPNNKKTLKQPVFISLKNSPIMPMAGIYKTNEDGTAGCSIITTTPLKSVEKVHNRMPFILNPDSIFDYLSSRLDNDKKLILDWMKNNIVDNDNLTYYPVNSAVGKVGNNSPELLDKCEPLFEI